MNSHRDRAFNAEIEVLRQQTLLMGAYTEDLVRAALRALSSRDSKAAETAIALDTQIDELEMQCDELCLRILAKRQPVASDLRLVTGTIKLIPNLERIGDLAVNIAERARELSSDTPTAFLQNESAGLVSLGEEAASMLRSALDAFSQSDVALAESVLGRDDNVDKMFATMFRGYIEWMGQDVTHIASASRCQSIAKYIERIADHATNIAENVIFIVGARDVRHRRSV